MGLLYQDIMKVPGLSGTWQQRNADLYKKLGSPMGNYTGSYSQNVWLLNQLKNNDYFNGGLPGSKSSSKKDNTSTLDSYVDPYTDNVKVDERVYSQDVMPLNEWQGVFDTWTQNFVDTYVRPEWEKDTYNPAMQQMTNDVNRANQDMGNSGRWRTSGAHNKMADMANEAIRQEGNLRRDFNDQTVNIRNAMNENLANPLYEANMRRFVEAPWRNMDMGSEMANDLTNMGGNAYNNFVQSLSDQGINYNSVNDVNSAIDSLNSWNPNSSNNNVTSRDWSTQGNNYGGMGTSLFQQYTNQQNSPYGQYATPANRGGFGGLGNLYKMY